MINLWSAIPIWFFVFTSTFSGNSFHGIYLSHTEIEVTGETLEISVRVFSNDLQNALKNHDAFGYQPADLDLFFSLNEQLAEHYFNEYFQIWNEGSPISLKLESFSIEGDAHFIKLRSRLPENSISLTLKADFFMELFPTQMNIIQIKSGTQVQYLRFNNPVIPQTIKLDSK